MHPILLNIFLVGTGGFIGAVFRYGLIALSQRSAPISEFPWGTVIVNLLGCLLIGLVAGLVEGRQWLSPEARLFVLVGVLGGFTTFSTFGFETFALLRDADYLPAIAYVIVQVFMGLALVWLGFVLTSARHT